MSDKEITDLGEQEFDLLLEDMIDAPPPADLEHTFKPWRMSMNRVLWGTGLTTITLNFWNLNVILPAIGVILLMLGYRALRQENHWFRIGYHIALLRVIWWLMAFSVNLTVYSGESDVVAFLTVGTYLMLIPGFIGLVALRNGIREVQKKAGLPPHGGNGMLVWYLIMTGLGMINFSGFSVWGLLIAYGFILRNLYLLSKELDEAGYAISPAPVNISDRTLKLAYTGIIAVIMVVGFVFLQKYPMDWKPLEQSSDSNVQEVKTQLLELGFPERVLNDMTNEEILSCEGAAFILVYQRDEDVDQGRGIGTQEEIDNGKIALITEDQAERQLRTTYVGVKFDDGREKWKLIHHFEWLFDRTFYGTEAIQMWPYSQTGWDVTGDFTGRLLYESDGQTLTSSYHSLGKVTYKRDNMLSHMLGQQESTDVFATFSLPNRGSNHRGYVMYELSEMMDGYIISSWFNYIHQHNWLQFPYRTAMEFEMTSFSSRDWVFKTIQTAFQFTTHGVVPELF